MTETKKITVDGNEAAASIAFRASEVIAIYPITPASPMGELAEEWASKGRRNIWGSTPCVQEMQSEAGAAGAVHGALQAGTLATTFTASQGLLLMIPNMYKIAGELTPFVMHVAARSLAAHALSIFGDHSDVMACRGTGFAMLCSSTPQEAHDFAAVAHAATLTSRIPFLHFFDGFRTSHEIGKVELIDDQTLASLLDAGAITAHRKRALSPDHPVIRGTAQNPDVFFQAREACNLFYDACPAEVAKAFELLERATGRRYDLFEYFGHPQAERVILLMGSGVTTARLLVNQLVARGEKVGVLAVRLFRPFSVIHFLRELPPTVKALAVLDRTKDPGSSGEPLLQEVAAALLRTPLRPRVVGGRYGLSSKEFTPGMVQAVFDELGQAEPRERFTVGIVDDVTHLSLEVTQQPAVLPADTYQAMFFGLGADGTVGANKNTIKVIGELTELSVQGHFVYDSKKSGAMTVSHLRMGKGEVAAPFLIQDADFVACHHFAFIERIDVLEHIKQGGTFLLNAPYCAEQVWDRLPQEVQSTIIEKKLQLYVIDAASVAEAAGVGKRINTVMQVCFFQLAGVVPLDVATNGIKQAIRKTYGRKGDEIVAANLRAVDATLANLLQVNVPERVTSVTQRKLAVPLDAPAHVQAVTAAMLDGKGDLLPVSAFSPDGTWQLGTTKWEKRDIADVLPEWDPELCIQCNKCVLMCPHAALRAKVFEPSLLEQAPQDFQYLSFKSTALKDKLYTIALSPDDCTGCNLCASACPATDKQDRSRKSLMMVPKNGQAQTQREHFAFFTDTLPELHDAPAKLDVKHSQLKQPLFEFSGACSGCGQTPYVKLLTQLYGDRLLIANATGCSSIYGGNLPTTPYTVNDDGYGPAWSNSLFEDNAEFGLGFRLAVDQLRTQARSLLCELAPVLSSAPVEDLLGAPQTNDEEIDRQRTRVKTLKNALSIVSGAEARRLEDLADYLVEKSVWIVGGDGWAFDIGFGGLDHVLAQPHDVNILVLDTGAYSNTGGQQSKSTPLGASAKFAAAGKESVRKDLGMIAMSYPHAYVAQVCLGAKDQQTIRALSEAAAHPGPSIVIAYAHCIAHGCDMSDGMERQRLAVETGFWPLYRFDPKLAEQGKGPLQLDAGFEPKQPMSAFTQGENRFRTVARFGEQRFSALQTAMQQDVDVRTSRLRETAARLAAEAAERLKGRSET